MTGVTDLDQLVFDRAHLKYRADSWSLTVGKQRIAWGTGYIWNPVDIFNPYVLSFAVRDEDKANVNALRWEMPLGEAGGIALNAEYYFNGLGSRRGCCRSKRYGTSKPQRTMISAGPSAVSCRNTWQTTLSRR